MVKTLFTSKSHKLAYILCALLILVFILLWMTEVAPYLKRIPRDLYYSANILSIDNFYDETKKRFQGEHISKTKFSYNVINAFQDYFKIENKFEVSTLNDAPIIAVKRIYFINPYTGQHISVIGQQKRSGYLFGPQYADAKDYYYWHINYNTQALLKYINKEYINGLEVYHYHTNYSADQSADLTHLPGVPDKRGIKTDVNLDLWIEPISGWLVKYQDKSVANYYDKKTGVVISPWNQFSNRYTLNSVREQVKKARYLKRRMLIIDYIVPCLLLTIMIVLLLLAFQIKVLSNLFVNRLMDTWIQNREDVYRYCLSSILVILTAITIYYFEFYGKKPIIFTIGISTWSDNIDLADTIKGFKAGLASSGYKESININYIIRNPNSNIENQIYILQSFLNQDVDMLFVLTEQGTLVAKGVTAKTPIVFASVIYPEEANIISTAQNSQRNLVGVRNYIPLAKQFNIFEKVFPNTKVLGFVHHKGDPESVFQFHEFQKLLSYRNIQVIEIPALDLEDLNQQLQRMDLNYNALFLACDSLIQGGGGKIVADYSNKNRIPNFSCDRNSIQNGALIGIVASPYATGLMAGKQAALILDGAKPEWLHTEAPDHGTIIINSQSAKILGIEIPDDLLKQAGLNIQGKKQ